ncbi:hypothetical protein HDK77DRAFT_507605, partial [Phyllosticta capitalensis]
FRRAQKTNCRAPLLLSTESVAALLIPLDYGPFQALKPALIATMKPPVRKNRGRRGVVKTEPKDDAPTSLPPATPAAPPVAQSPPAEGPKKSLIVKLPLPAASLPLRPVRPSKIVKLKVPPIPPRPQKIAKLPMRPSKLVGVARPSNDMRIEARYEALQRRQREREMASTRPQTGSYRGLPPPISPPRMSPALQDMLMPMEPPRRRVRFDLGTSAMPPAMPPPLSPLAVGTMTPGLSEGLGPYPPGFEPDAVVKSPPSMLPPMLSMTPDAHAPPTPLLPNNSTAAPQGVLVPLAHDHTPAATKSAAPPQGGSMTPAPRPLAAPNVPTRVLPKTPRVRAPPTLMPTTMSAAGAQGGSMILAHERAAAERLEALLEPPPSTELLPPSRTLAPKTKSKSKRRRGVVKRQHKQDMVMRPVPTGIPPGPVPLYPYGHKWKLEPKDKFINRFARMHAAQEAKKEEDKQWDARVAANCQKFREEYPKADEELMEWREQRRPADWDMHYPIA